jgi:APA family basic amino acid/polyamine antiporter
MSEQSAWIEERLAGGGAELGLRRALGVWGAAAFVITNMVGTGIFTVPAFVRTATGHGLAALGVWLAGAGLALSGALCYAELATRMPEAGGEYYYLTRVYGRLWGFLSGWISFFVGFSAAIAAASLGAIAYAGAALPGWNPQALLIPEWGITQGGAAAAALVIALAIFHATGVRPSGRLQTMIAAVVVGAIIILVIAGIGSGRGDWRGVVSGSEPTGQWWIALIQVSFAYSGWNAAAYLSGEVRNPRRTLPRALIGGTVAVAVIYLALNLLFLYALPADSWQPTIAVGKLAAERLFGVEGARAVSAIIALMILGSVSAMTAAGPRVYYAMARDRLAPAAFSRLGQRSSAPGLAMLVQAGVAAAMALTGAFETLLIYVGSALLLFSALTVTAVYVIPRPAATDSPRFFRVPGYPFTPAIFLVLVTISWLQGLSESPLPTGAALLTMLIGMIVFFVGRALGWFDRETTQGRRAP